MGNCWLCTCACLILMATGQLMVKYFVLLLMALHENRMESILHLIWFCLLIC